MAYGCLLLCHYGFDPLLVSATELARLPAPRSTLHTRLLTLALCARST